eukprot:CAMPEP_0171107062 /NCGR_PEP_ID=MMETSP0766_2-20121228/66070_1 /TAXON_ID=439317 /ORGANISM="Gambierdiscus australes, Strain CAWD 149" /LENGTH=345 /DNA_ID=CAMNT_0011568287 /DNA_START=52 /DNA_END=1089 /DNA_ORIENTATION=-
MVTHSNLYVTGLPDGLDELTFRQLFEGYGTITSVKLFASMRYGFVKFSTVEDAQTVVDEMNGSEWGNSQLVVKFANNDQGQSSGGHRSTQQSSWSSTAGGTRNVRDPSTPGDQVYIKGLPLDFTDDQLLEVFSAYGQVVWHKVLKRDGASDSVALVQMSSVDEATWIVENLHGNIPQGLTMAVSITFSAGPKNKRGAAGGGGGGGCGSTWGLVPASSGSRYSPYSNSAPEGGASDGNLWQMLQGFSAHKASFSDFNDGSNLYIKGLPNTVDELYLYKLFAPFGGIQSVKPVVQDWGAIGFVKFTHAEEAQVAISQLNGQMMPDGSVIQVSVKSARKGTAAAGEAS